MEVQLLTKIDSFSKRNESFNFNHKLYRSILFCSLQIHSVVKSVIVGTLIGFNINDGDTPRNVNLELIKDKYGEKAEEALLCKVIHERNKSQHRQDKIKIQDVSRQLCTGPKKSSGLKLPTGRFPSNCIGFLCSCSLLVALCCWWWWICNAWRKNN